MWLLLPALVWTCLGVGSASALVITNVSPVNVTPSGFSVVWASVPPVLPSISIFADAGGLTNLAGSLGVEFFPVDTGSPVATNSYDRRLNQAVIRQNSLNRGVVQVRITGCTPNTTYYYRLQVSDTLGQTLTYPVSGPLPSVTTAVENSFVVQSRQVVITLPGADVSGEIVTLHNTNTPSVLAAVAGDGAGPNEVVFSVTDLLAALGATNFLPVGSQELTLKILGTAANSLLQTYDINFTTDFLVGQVDHTSLSQFVQLGIGSAILRAGSNGSLPISFYASAVTNLSFALTLPTNRFSSLSVQALAPALSQASLTPIGSNHVLLSFVTSPGQSLQGNQQIAQLNFTLASSQPSAFIQLAPEPPQIGTADGSVVTNLALLTGRLVVIGNEPLLESSITPANSRNLALYGKPGASYEIDYSTNLNNPAAWTFLTRMPQTNLVQTLEGLDQGRPTVFFRAFEFTAIPPILDALPGNHLVVYGAPWSAYAVDYATSLSFPVNWTLLARLPLTNSFQFLTAPPSAPNAFYRVRSLASGPPELEALPGNRLIAFGAPWSAYVVEYATSLTFPINWSLLTRLPLTNGFQFLTAPPSATNAFYRIRALASDPPVLDARLNGASRSLMLYGAAGTNYVLQYTTNLSGVVTWHPVLAYTLTNSFKSLNVGNTAPAIFYRIQR